MSKKISDKVCKNVLLHHQNGLSNVKISKMEKISATSVRRILKNMENINSKNSGGRPKILKPRETNVLVREFSKGSLETTTNGVELVKNYFEKNISNSTVRNILKENNFQNYKKIPKPFISRVNFQKRKNFYNLHRNFTYQDFGKYVFTDEASFQLLNAAGGQTYYKKKNVSTSTKSFIRTKKFGGGSIMIWGFITFFGQLKIYRVNGKMDSNKYIRLLEDEFIDDAVLCGLNLGEMVFQQDNASCHVSKKTLNWVKEQNINVLSWPPQSPDMNPIEDVWNYLDSQVRKRQPEIKTIDDLWRILDEEAAKISPEYIKKLYKSLPRRISALKKSNFDVTKY